MLQTVEAMIYGVQSSAIPWTVLLIVLSLAGLLDQLISIITKK